MPAPLGRSENSHGRLGGTELVKFEEGVSDDGVRRRYGEVCHWQDPSSRIGRTELSSRENNL